MYPSDFKLDKSSPISKASPEHEEGNIFTEEEKAKYIANKLEKYMNITVSPGFRWNCSWSSFYTFSINSPKSMINIRFEEDINELYDKIKKTNEDAVDFIEDIKIELSSFDVKVEDNNGKIVDCSYKFYGFPETISSLKKCLNKGMPKEIIYKNWYFLPVHGYFGDKYYNFYLCLNNGKIYSIVESKNSELQYLSSVLIYKLGNSVVFTTTVDYDCAYRNGTFYNISNGVATESITHDLNRSKFEKINMKVDAFSTITIDAISNFV